VEPSRASYRKNITGDTVYLRAGAKESLDYFALSRRYQGARTRFSVARPHGSGVSRTTVLSLTLKLQTISQSRSPSLSRLMFAMEDRRRNAENVIILLTPIGIAI
jgi:hypothetical protein